MNHKILNISLLFQLDLLPCLLWSLLCGLSASFEDVGKCSKCKTNEHYKGYPLVCAAILVTGGYPEPAGGDSAVSAEVLRADGTAWCSLPPLPYRTIVHSQSGD